MVSGCWVETTIEADDALCKTFEDDDATASITLATENKLSCLQCVGSSVFNFHYFNRLFIFVGINNTALKQQKNY